MSRRANEVTKDQLIEEFHSVVAETEQLLNSVATAGGEKADAMRAGAEQNLARAKGRLREFRSAAARKTAAATRAADNYVHENPWKAIGVAAAVNVVAGVVLGLLLLRR